METQTTDRMVTHDLYMRHTACNGKSYVQEHRVWDGAKFVLSQQLAAEKLNADQKDPEQRKAAAEQITEETYRKEKTK